MPKRFVRDRPAPADSNARLDCNTTYTDDFIKHPFGPRESMHPVPRVEMTGPMQSDTTNSVDYWDKSKNMQPRKKMAPQTHHGSGKFCGDTTYNVDFADRGKGSPVVVVKHGCSLGSSGAKFNGDTTYHDDFRKWNIPKINTTIFDKSKSMFISQEILEPLDLLLVQPLTKLTSRVNQLPKNALFWLMANLHLSVEIICAIRCKKYVHLQTFKF
jgi:hypothetical protein